MRPTARPYHYLFYQDLEVGPREDRCGGPRAANGAAGRKPRDLNLLHKGRLNPARDGASPRVGLGPSCLCPPVRQEARVPAQVYSPRLCCTGRQCAAVARAQPSRPDSN